MNRCDSRTRRSIVTIGIVVATTMLVVGCGSEDSTDASENPENPTSPVATSTPAAAPALEGAWQTEPTSLEDMEATLRSHGLDEWIDDFRANAPYSEDTVLTLRIESGAWDLYGQTGNGEPQPIDYDAEYEIDGDTVVFHHSDGSNTYRWQVADDTLTLEFLETTLPGYRGIPDEVFQRALYMTATFTRQG